MNDYQMPLFDRYDLSVEFERHLRPVRQRLVEEWDRYSFMSDEQLTDCFEGQMVCPIELLPERASLDHVEGKLYELAVPYRGDDELWHLFPVDVVWGVLGEVFRGALLLQALAGSAAEAQAHFDERLKHISAILDLQKQRIEIFERALPSIIRSQASQARRPLPDVPGAIS